MKKLLIQEELFPLNDFFDNTKETINKNDYVYIKRTSDKIIPIHTKQQGYVTKVEEIDGERLCTVFFVPTLEKYHDYQLTKRVP